MWPKECVEMYSSPNAAAQYPYKGPSPLTNFASSFSKINRFYVVMALYSYTSQRMSKHAENISETLNCAQLILGIQLLKRSTMVNSAVVSLAFSLLCYSVAPFAILLHFNH